MKRFLYVVALCLLAAATSVQANDYLEQERHYTVMSMGNGVLRFYVPIWVYGRANDYYLEGHNDFSSTEDSYIWYSTSPNASRGSSSVHRIASVSAVRYGKNDQDGSEGQGYIYIHEGSAIIQSTFNGEPIVLQAGDDTYWAGWQRQMSLKRKEDDDHKRITYFIFDWYPPTSLQNTDFYWGVSANIYKKSSGESSYKHWWAKPDKFRGNKTPQTPELFQPYFYAMDEGGATGYGCAGVQFTVYQEPVSYHTSLNSQEVLLNERASTIVVPTKDTVQRFFSGSFTVKVDDGGNTQTLKSNEVHIPAYHRVYDLSGQEVLDEKKTVTGDVQLSWQIHNPSAQDLIEGDVFEVQRATQADFSDAETIETVPYRRDSANYHVKDNPLLALGADTSELDQKEQSMYVTRKVVSKDAAGKPYAEYEVRLSSEKVKFPGRSIYYRVRRASASIWGWDHEFAKTAKVVSQDYLAPLAETQEAYTKDPDFATNRKVHFHLRLDNSTVTPVTEPETQCRYTAKVSKMVIDSFPVRVQAIRDMNNMGAYTPADYEFVLEITKGNLVEEKPLKITKYYSYCSSSYPADAERVRLVVRERTSGRRVMGTNTAAIGVPYVKTVILKFGQGDYAKAEFDYDGNVYRQLKDSLENAHPLKHDSMRHELYLELQQKIASVGAEGNPRCTWDKNALLYLRRTLTETGETIEYVVPQDSIVRNADGTWGAHMVVEADRACVHYQYSVRIDQSNSMVKVINPDQLLPKTIQGPDLFYNEVASIARFHATDGDDRYSVLLNWEPTPGGLDVYELRRREAGSTAAYDSLTTTTETDYRDSDVEPGKQYEYQLTARYTCNSTTTTSTATTTGRRSPYGRISGRIHYADGTGCPGVKVTLTATGAADARTTVTDEQGIYVFDSLLYGAGKTYAIVPTSTTAEFRFNNTTATTAFVGLSADNPVADAIQFENISSVRLSGRVLYAKSSIPVREANILINDRVVKTAGGELKTDISGNFELCVPRGAGFTLRVTKPGHTFEGDGYVRMNNSTTLALTEPQDGVRVWDQTKVRLAGRVVGGRVQAEKPLGFSLSQNNLGDDLQLVLELEGDNISHIVRDENDLTRDTMEYTVQHEVSGETQVHYLRKRIVINPDPQTGEFFADLFPVRYKITQATASGYATLFAEGKTSETLELSDAARMMDSVVYGDDTIRFNARYDITYRSPISISCIQLRYGMPLDFYGEQSMVRQNIQNEEIEVPLVMRDTLGDLHYLFGAPVFGMGKYRFRITAHEDYYYNNEQNGRHEEVRLQGGKLKVYNGLYDAVSTQILTESLDRNGQADVTLPVDYVSFLKTGEQALRVLDLSVESDGQYVEQTALSAYVTGNKAKERNFLTTANAGVTRLDILRDPPGSSSYAYIEKGTTYKYNYTWSFTGKFGVEIGAKYGTGNSINMGSYLGTPGGIFSGYNINTSVANTFALPISSQVDYKRSSSYTFTTSERIETGNDTWFVGSRGDVYIGATQTAYFGLTDAVKPLDSLTYVSLAARLEGNAGASASMHTVAEGRDLKGNKYYLVIGEETEAGAAVTGTFAYTQDYILNTMLPKLIRERNALLVTGDSMTVQQIANVRKDVVYWSKVPADADEYALTSYVKLYPNGKNTNWIDIDEVASYNKQILNWINLIKQNEREKLTLMSGVNADSVGTYSVSSGVKLSHSETYDYSSTIAYRWDFPGGNLSGTFATKFASALSGVSENITRMITNFVNLVPNNDNHRIERTGVDPLELDGTVPGAKWSFTIKPILDVNFDRDPSEVKEHKKSAGFVLQSDSYSSMNVSVLRLREPQNEFNQDSQNEREFIDNGNDYDGTSYQYGSFIYVLNGGATKCPWEGPEESVFYEIGGQPAIISRGTAKLENPKIDLTVHERSDVPHDKAAIFNLRLSNEVEDDISGNAGFVIFKLRVEDASNPKGAKILMDGMPLIGQARDIKINPGQVINKTLEVYAGEDYDYEDITLTLFSTCDVLTYDKASFTVHYMPVSCPVSISAPHDKWVMNTLSPRDSAGYYMPIVIDGFDVNYNNFDHIEFQYKLTKQSDDAWVNLCSYYADSTLYRAASGSKDMIRGGRIDNIRFYGERDPMEQQYDLRAVSFCRHGSSFITRTSPVLTGVKDTRPPVVFGEPEPANSILGVGDHLKLRFNEAIAGNYLDEDNNFQITGITNATGLSSATALHFNGHSSATTKAKRDLTDKSFTVDMMIRPTEAGSRAADMILFETGDGQSTKQLILTRDNRLRMIQTVGKNSLGKTSNVLDPILSFQRVLVVYDKPSNRILFYHGNKDVTSNLIGETSHQEDAHESSAYFTFGSSYRGDMLETRIWTKALTPEEISATAGHTLTGYERELLAYYRMDEGKGETVSDHAHGATLYLNGCSWNKRKGYSLRLEDDSVRLDGNLMGRSAVYDETLMLWFRAETNGTLFRADNTRIALKDGRLVLHSGQTEKTANAQLVNNEWHHLVLTISRTYNSAAIFVDGKIYQTFSASDLQGITGTMYLGGTGFRGLIDEFSIFEQALPQQLVELYDENDLTGDEMGLMAYLPFEEQYTNQNGIMEQRFSVNDQRVFKDGKGNVVNKVVPLLLDNAQTSTDNAPVKSHGELKKLHFNWAFNNDELLINILNRDYEVNKQSIYVTVRDVEDLNGNPMTSPVTWTAFVDRNSLKWSAKQLIMESNDHEQSDLSSVVRIVNQSGKRHTYTIESMPSWLRVDAAYGAIDPMGEQTVRLTFTSQTPVGEYSDFIYLTDEDGLSEPLQVVYRVKAMPPYENMDEGKYPLNMSICARVEITTDDGFFFDNDERDIVYALYRNECVGQANVTVNAASNTADVYLTVLGQDEMNRKQIQFQLWQASTGKVYDLTANRNVLFSHGFVYGCDGEPLVLTTSGSERQQIQLYAGWNWSSVNLDLHATGGRLETCMSAAQPWTEGDLIKNPATRQFSTYNEANNAFVGTLLSLHHKQMYMIYTAKGNTMRISGELLPSDSMTISVRGDGQWSPMPCLLDQRTSVTEALADYYQKAGTGDMIKAHNRFATFSADKRWVGDLQALVPGEGYLFRRMAPGTVEIAFHRKEQAQSTQNNRNNLITQTAPTAFSNPQAATNMTMIARVEGNPPCMTDATIRVYVGDELACVATPVTGNPSPVTENLYFLTIQSDRVGELRFELDGQTLVPSSINRTSYICPSSIEYIPDAHYGSLDEPLVLVPVTGNPSPVTAPYKIIENDHIVIIRNNEKYDVTGKKL